MLELIGGVEVQPRTTYTFSCYFKSGRCRHRLVWRWNEVADAAPFPPRYPRPMGATGSVFRYRSRGDADPRADQYRKAPPAAFGSMTCSSFRGRRARASCGHQARRADHENRASWPRISGPNGTMRRGWMEPDTIWAGEVPFCGGHSAGQGSAPRTVRVTRRDVDRQADHDRGKGPCGANPAGRSSSRNLPARGVRTGRHRGGRRADFLAVARQLTQRRDTPVGCQQHGPCPGEQPHRASGDRPRRKSHNAAARANRVASSVGP